MPNIITTGTPIDPVEAKVFAKDTLGNYGYVNYTKAPRTTPVRVGVFGDSTAVIGTTQSPANHDVSVVSAAYPVSGTTALSLTGDKFTLPMFYPNAFAVFAGGVSGEATTQILARDAAVAGITRRALSDIGDFSLDLLIIRAMINDIASLSAATSTQAHIDAIWARYLLIVNRAMANVPIILCESIAGYSPAVVDPDLTFRRTALLYLNEQILTLPSLYPGRVYACDLTDYTLNTNGSFITGCSNDGVHDNAYGAYKRGEAEAICVKAIFGPSYGPRYKGINLFSNSLFANTTTTGQGVVATGVTITASNATATGAQVEVINGQLWQTVVITPTAYDGSASGNIKMTFDPSALAWAENSIYGFEFDFLIELTNGMRPVTVANGMNVSLLIYKSGAGQITVENAFGNVTTDALGGYKGRAVFPPFKTAEAGSVLTAACCINLQSLFTGEIPLKLGISSPRMVLQL